MADDQVTVELVAKVDALTSGLTEAVNAMRETVEAIRGDTDKLTETAEESSETLKKILTGEYFIIFKEAAEKAFEFVKEGFESTIGAAEEFGLSNAKFAAMMGTSETEAAGLSAALRGVGSSSEEFSGMALRMQMRLNSNEEAFTKLGVVTRDANGNLLSGKELMDSAISTLETYKSSSDQNAVALELFGRRAADVYQIMRVSEEGVAHQIDIYKQFGVQLDGAGETAEGVEETMNDLRTMFQAAGLALGQQLTPLVKDFANVIQTVGVPVLEGMITGVKFLAVAFEGTGAAVMNVATVIKLAFMEIVDAFKAVGTLIYDALHGSWGEMKTDAANAWAEMKTDAKSAADDIATQWSVVGDAADKLFGTPEAPSGAKPKSGTRRAPPKAGKEDNSQDEAIQAAEKLAEAEISIEESTNAHLLAMGQEELEQFVSQARQLENEKYSVKLDALNKELALPGRTKAEIQKTNDEIELLDVTHAGALVKIEQDAASRKAAAARASLTEFIKVDDDKLKSGIDAIKALEDAGKLGSLAAGEQEAALTVQIRQEQLARLDAEMATMSKTSAEYKKLNAEKAKLEHEFTQALVADQKQAASALAADMKTGLAPVLGGFNTAINEMIEKGKSFHQAMQDMWKSILSGFLSMIERMAEEWAIKQIANAVVAQTSIGTSARLQIAAEAALASAAAFASTAAIPIVGLAAAPGAGATAYGEVMAMQGLVPAAAGGMLLNRDQLVYAHKDEQILPAHLSKGIQDMISRGSGAGGDITLNYNGVANGGGDLPTLLRKHSDAMAAWIHQARRDGKI